MTSGPIGPRSDIAPKRGFFVSLLNEREAKKVSAMLSGGIWIKIHLNLEFLDILKY
jgi:hypothetical protein